VVDERSLDGVLGLEDAIELLKRAVLGLGHHEVEDGRLHKVPDDEDDVGLPLDLLESDGPRELAHHAAGVDGERGEGHALGTHLEGEDFDGVQGLERGETNGVDGAEDEDHGDGCLGRGLVGLARLAEQGGGGGHADPDNAATNHREEHERAATDAVYPCGTEKCEDELEAGVAKNNVGLRDLICVTSSVKDTRKEVGEHGVAGPLREDGEDDVASKTVTAGTSVEKRAVVPPALVGTLPEKRQHIRKLKCEAEMYSHVQEALVLLQLKCHPGRILIAVTVVFGKHGDGFLALVVDVEPTRRFGNEPRQEHNQSWEHHL